MGLVTKALVAVCLVAGVTAAEQTPDAATVLAKAREALGGEKKLSAIKTIVAQGQTRQVRGDTLRLLEKTPDDWLTFAAAGTSNHILWHAGHALWLQDVLFIEPATERSELPKGWEETFGMDCRPVSRSGYYPRRLSLSIRESSSGPGDNRGQKVLSECGRSAFQLV